MQSDNSLEAKRIAFFKRAREELKTGMDPIVWESEFADLWPGQDGKFDQRAAFNAFQQENLHWIWEVPDDVAMTRRPNNSFEPKPLRRPV